MPARILRRHSKRGVNFLGNLNSIRQWLPVLQKLCNEQLCEWQARWILVRMREHFGRGRIAATALRAILDQLRSNGARLAPGSDAITLPFDSAEEAEAFLALPVDGYVPPGSKVGSRTASEALRDQRAVLGVGPEHDAPRRGQLLSTALAPRGLAR